MRRRALLLTIGAVAVLALAAFWLIRRSGKPEVVWEHSLGPSADVFCGLATNSNAVFVAQEWTVNGPSCVHKLRLSDGEEEWCADLPEDAIDLAADDQLVYVVLPNELRALSVHDSSQAWSALRDTPALLVRQPGPSLLLWVRGEAADRLVSLHRADGTTVWESPQLPVDGCPTEVPRGTGLLVQGEQSIIKIDTTTGRIVGRSDPVQPRDMCVSGPSVYVVSEHEVHCLDVETLEHRWHRQLDTFYVHRALTPAVSGPAVVWTYGEMVRLDPQTGEPLWRHHVEPGKEIEDNIVDVWVWEAYVLVSFQNEWLGMEGSALRWYSLEDGQRLGETPGIWNPRLAAVPDGVLVCDHYGRVLLMRPARHWARH